MAPDQSKSIDHGAKGSGEAPVLLPPAVIDGFESPMGPVPALGQHTDAVLTEFGVAPADLESLRERGVIGTPR